MEINTIIELIKTPANRSVIERAQAFKKESDLILLGQGYFKDLENRRMLKHESTSLFNAKKRFCVPKTPSVFNKIDRQFKKAFRADGFNQTIVFKTENEKLANEAEQYLANFFNGKGLREFMANDWSTAIKEDCNGIYLVETSDQLDIEGNAQPLIDFYSIYNVRDFAANYDGTLKYLILAYKVDTAKPYKLWRYIDAEKDIVIKEENNQFDININDFGAPDILANTLGFVPAIHVSNYRFSKSEKDLRVNHLFFGIGLGKQYQDVCDDAVVTMKKHGNPLFYARPLTCHTCNGRGEVATKDGDLIGCTTCNGLKVVAFPKGDPTEGITIPISDNFDADNGTTPAPAGYVTPDIATINEQRVEKEHRKGDIEEAVIGARGLIDRGLSTNESGIKAMIDLQPLLDTIDEYVNNAEYVHQFLAYTMLAIRFGENFKDIQVRYGRKYLVKTENEAQNDYELAKKSGLPDSVLRESLTEYIKIKFENNPKEQARSLFLVDLEPFPTYTLKEIKELGLANEQDKLIKQYFNDLVEAFERDFGNIMLHSGTLDKIYKQFEVYLTAWGLIKGENEAATNYSESYTSLRSTVGAGTIVSDILTKASQGQIPKESAKETLKLLLGFSQLEVDAMINPITIQKVEPNTFNKF